MDDFLRMFCESSEKDCRDAFGRFLFGDQFDAGESNTEREEDIWDLLVSFLGGTFMGGDIIANKIKSGKIFEEFKKLKECEKSFINTNAVAEKVPVLYRGTTFDPDVIFKTEGWERESGGNLRSGFRKLVKKREKDVPDNFTYNVIQTDYTYTAGSPIQSWTADPSIASEFSRFQINVRVEKIVNAVKKIGKLDSEASNQEFADYAVKLNEMLGGDFRELNKLLHNLSTAIAIAPKGVIVWEKPDIDQLLFNIDFIHTVLKKADLNFGEESEVIRISKEPIETKLAMPHSLFMSRRIMKKLWGDGTQFPKIIKRLLGQVSRITSEVPKKERPPETHTF